MLATVAAATSSAVAGTYSLTVNMIAAANEIASQGYASASSQITQGTLTIGSGSNTATITVGPTNNTLQGLANAINIANDGVSATVINDGTSTPYRLLLTADNTGTSNAITVTNNLAASSSGAVKPGFGAADSSDTSHVGSTVQAAVNASLTLGSGSGALTVSSQSNTVGQRHQRSRREPASASATPISITVANDTTTATTAIQNVVTAYNSVMSTISQRRYVPYVPSSGTAGSLLGDSSILQIRNQLTNQITGIVAGANSKLNSLSALGITADSSGQLQINNTQLSNVLSGKVSGVSLSDVRSLFALAGSSTNTGVSFINATTATQASSAGYGVVVTQAAHQATLTADQTLSTTVTSGNNSFSLTANGQTSGTITLPAQTYSSDSALVAALQTQINSDKTVGGLVNVGLSNNQLTFTTTGYGQAATLALARQRVSWVSARPLPARRARRRGSVSGQRQNRGRHGPGANLDGQHGERKHR